jgi:ubiquitin carboxyl-terminal hydrolase 7
MIEQMKAKQSLKAAELQDGDIICFQKAPENKASETDHESGSPNTTNSKSTTDSDGRSILSKSSQLDRIDDAPKFYDFLHYRRIVQFYPHRTRNANPDAFKPFDLILSSKQTYDQVAAKVGEQLSVDPTYLRFWTVNVTTGNPKATVKRAQSPTLQAILNPPYGTFSNNNQRSDCLYFEILDISLSELDTKRTLKVTWLSEGITKEVRI